MGFWKSTEQRKAEEASRKNWASTRKLQKTEQRILRKFHIGDSEIQQFTPEAQRRVSWLTEQLKVDPKGIAESLQNAKPQTPQEKQDWLNEYFLKISTASNQSGEPTPQEEARKSPAPTSTKEQTRETPSRRFVDWLEAGTEVVMKGVVSTIHDHQKQIKAEKPGPGIGPHTTRRFVEGAAGQSGESKAADAEKPEKGKPQDTKKQARSSLIKRITSAHNRATSKPGTEGSSAYEEIGRVLGEEAAALSSYEPEQKAIARVGFNALASTGNAEVAHDTMTKVGKTLENSDIPQGLRAMWLNTAANVSSPEEAAAFKRNLEDQGYLKKK